MVRAFPTLLLWLLGLVSLTALTGCGSVGKLGGVTVAVLGLRSPAAEATSHGKIVMNLRFTNENVVPVGISRARHKLFLNGSLAGEVMNTNAVGLPPLATATQDVLLSLNAATAANWQQLVQRSPVDYRIESVLYVDAGEETLDIKTRNQGAVDLTGVPAKK